MYLIFLDFTQAALLTNIENGLSQSSPFIVGMNFRVNRMIIKQTVWLKRRSGSELMWNHIFIFKESLEK